MRIISSCLPPSSRFATAHELLGDLDDRPQGFAYCRCPGESRHSSRTSKTDCRVYYQDGPPTIFCLHTSCAGVVGETNRVLRSAIGKREAGGVVPPVKLAETREQAVRQRMKRETERLATRARNLMPKILCTYSWPTDQMFSDSPMPLTGGPEDDWRLLVSLFRPGDRLWIGDTRESGSPRHAHHFRTAAQWLAGDSCPVGPFILPAAVKATACTRRKEDLARLPFLVVESDLLPKEQIGAVFRWLHEVLSLPLCVVVDTAGKSLHGWFARPNGVTLHDLKAVLPAMQCDGAVLRDTQPVRLPGCVRPGMKARQTLLYFNPKAAQ